MEKSLKKAPKLTAERLREVLHYDPETGVFTWKVSTCRRMRAGQVAGCLDNTGYLKVSVDSCRHLLHRLAWLYVTGQWPDSSIDHINRERSDNRFVNLREASGSENQQNSKVSIRNTSGHKGVSYLGGKWKAQISLNKRCIYLGLYSDIAAAVAARRAAESAYHPYAPA